MSTYVELKMSRSDKLYVTLEEDSNKYLLFAPYGSPLHVSIVYFWDNLNGEQPYPSTSDEAIQRGWELEAPEDFSVNEKGFITRFSKETTPTDNKIYMQEEAARMKQLEEERKIINIDPNDPEVKARHAAFFKSLPLEAQQSVRNLVEAIPGSRIISVKPTEEN